MLIKEYRITLPLTVDEYRLAQLYTVAEASKNETGGGEGVEVVKNEAFKGFKLLKNQPMDGQYTYKIYHLASKVPKFVRLLVPKGALEIYEEAWNAYPFCRTVLTNPNYMKEKFVLSIESLHLADRGTTENALNLSIEDLEKREVVHLDISNDHVSEIDYKLEYDPSKFKSAKTGRGPFTGDWIKSTNPIMTCYKLVRSDFQWFGVQQRMEKFIQKSERRLFTNFHRQVVCSMDEWYGLTMNDIRAIEDRTKSELDEQRKKGPVRGTRSSDTD